MIIFITILFKLIAAFCSVFLGYISGKLLKVDRDTIANILFYLLSPLVIFYSVARAPITLHTLSFPLLTFTIASTISILFYYISRNMWHDSSSNILAFAAGNGNTGYFALPVVALVFKPELTSVFVLGMLGVVFYEYSVGFFITARSHQNIKDCLIRILKLPVLYAFILGVLYSASKLAIPELFNDFMRNIMGSYSTFGMMLIGIGISNIGTGKFDWKFVTLAFLGRFIIWPLISFSIIFLDRHFINYYNESIYNALLILSVVPLAANTVVVASVLKVQPEKAAAAVLLSTLFALFYLPLFVLLFVDKSHLLIK